MELARPPGFRLPLAYWDMSAGADGLALEGVPIAALARTFGTPFYLFSEARLRADACRARAAAARHLPGGELLYSLKTNGHPRVLAILAEEGLGAEVISAAELEAAGRAGFDSRRTVFNGPGKSDGDLAAASAAGVLVQVESASEARALAAAARASRRLVAAGLRANPDLAEPRAPATLRMGAAGSPFGMDPEGSEFAAALAALRATAGAVEIVSLSAHIGTGLVSTAPYQALARRLAGLRARLAADGLAVPVLDLGGGFGVPSEVRYPEGAFDSLECGAPVVVPGPAEIAPFEEVCRAVAAELAGHPGAAGARVRLEPGRLLASDAFHLIARVMRIKEERGVRFVILDASRIQNALFVGRGYHEMVPVAAPLAPAAGPVELVGPLCASFDVWARSRALGPLVEGDLVAVLSIGAYNLAARSRWSFPPAPVVALGRDGPVCLPETV